MDPGHPLKQMETNSKTGLVEIMNLCHSYYQESDWGHGMEINGYFANRLKESLLKTNLSEFVEIYIEDQILRGVYAYGDRLLETELANRLGVSRGPVREAIRSLETKGVITIQPRKGARVANFVDRDFLEILEIRALIEYSIIESLIEIGAFTAKRLVALRSFVDEMQELEANPELDRTQVLFKLNELNMEFHKTIWNMSTSKRRQNILDSMLFQLRLAMLYDLNAIVEHDELKEAINSHYLLLDLIELGDLKEIRQSLRSHNRTLLEQES